MPRGYCTTCNAEVTVRDGQCLLGHRATAHSVTDTTKKDQPGRHRVGRSRPKRVGVAHDEPVVVRAGGMRLINMFGFREDTLTHETLTFAGNSAPTALPPSPAHPVVTPARETRRSTAPSVFDTLPKLSELRQKDSENTGNLIQLLWEATDSYEPEQTWMPKTQDLAALGKNDRRWGPKLAIGAAALTLVAGSMIYLQPDDSPAPIVQAAASTESAVAESEQILLNVRAVADLLASTEATGAELSSAAIALTDLDTVSRDLVLVSDDFTRASQPDLATLASEASARGIAISDQLSQSLSYRLVFNRILALPELPLEADTISISDIGFSLASSVADSRTALEDLPRDPVLDGQTLSALAAVDTVELLSADYLQALRDGDRLAAQVISNEIKAQSSELHAELPALLSEANMSVTTELTAFETALLGLEG